MSDRKQRESRREERVQAESDAEAQARRKRLVQLGAGAVFLVVIVVVVLIVVAGGGGSSGGDSSEIVDAAKVDAILGDIPQQEMTLGDPGAKVKVYEYGDLQCPFCKENSEHILPSVIEGPVKQGKASITFRNLTIIGPQSIPAGAAAIAAGKQGRGWNYLELFYRNQGEENSGYVTDDFMEAIAKAAGVKDLDRWNSDRKSKAVEEEVEKTTAGAERIGFSSTPSFTIEGPSTNGLEIVPTLESSGDLEKAIEEAS